MRAAIIDADSIIYIVAWNNKESDEELVIQSCDSIVNAILKKAEATHYLGAFSASVTFRQEVYKVAKYKGNRGEKPEWITKWGPVIKNHLMTNWGFVQASKCEADDVLAAMESLLEDSSIELVYCSPDKDLKQLPGLHFDYSKMENELESVNFEQSIDNYLTQLLTGDATDNVKGLFGVGPVKAAKLLASCIDHLDKYQMVINQYDQFYGDYYGPIILKETETTIGLLTPIHSLWEEYSPTMSGYRLLPVPEIDNDLPEL
jgi:5'-3' exonuclease